MLCVTLATLNAHHNLTHDLCEGVLAMMDTTSIDVLSMIHGGSGDGFLTTRTGHSIQTLHVCRELDIKSHRFLTQSDLSLSILSTTHFVRFVGLLLFLLDCSWWYLLPLLTRADQLLISDTLHSQWSSMQFMDDTILITHPQPTQCTTTNPV